MRKDGFWGVLMRELFRILATAVHHHDDMTVPLALGPSWNP